MWGAAYFAPRYFAARYWGEVGAAPSGNSATRIFTMGLVQNTGA
jgi:hypothetical protein